MACYRLMAALFLVMAWPVAAAPADDLHRLFDEEWQVRLARNPFFATREGDHRYDHLVPDVSAGAQARHLAEDRAFLDRLQAIDRAGLDEADRLNYDLFGFDIGSRVRRGEFRPWRMPFLSDSGFHTGPAMLVEATPFATSADYEAWIARLRGLATYIEQNIANMRIGMAEGFTMPRAILDKVEPSFAAHAVERVEDSVFHAPFERIPASFPEAERERLAAAGRAAVAEAVLPAYRRLHRFFVEDYMPAARATLGARDLPDGEAYYQMLIADYTTLDLDAERIHAIGLSETRRIRAEMAAIMAETGFEGSFAEFLAFLRSDPQFYPKSSQELLWRAAWLAKRADAVLPAFFGHLPRMPYGVRAVPEAIASNYTSGRYWGAIPGVRGGLYMVNTHALENRPLFELPALTLHEAVPGHHLQIALAEEIPDVPEFRKNLYVVAFGEGWGLYSEKLGIEMGIYETPYEHFGRLSFEMWRAGRLVVDTGIHAMGWTREQAVDFFRENSALSEHNINTEVDRYISWPGQALGYKMGELRIIGLRQHAESELGARFDLRAFHDALLGNGALPLPVLEQKIAAWINAVRGD